MDNSKNDTKIDNPNITVQTCDQEIHKMDSKILPESVPSREKRFIRRMKRKFCWLLLAICATITLAILTEIYGDLSITSEIALIYVTSFGIIIAFKEYLGEFIRSSNNKFKHVVSFPPIPIIGKYECCKKFCAIFLRIFGEDNPYDDLEEFQKLHTNDLQPFDNI